jgi:hypothetical protein
VPRCRVAEVFPLGQRSSVDLLEPNVLLLVTFVLAPDSGFGVIVLSPLIIQRRQLSFEFLMFLPCIALRGFSVSGSLAVCIERTNSASSFSWSSVSGGDSRTSLSLPICFSSSWIRFCRSFSAFLRSTSLLMKASWRAH